MPGPSFDLDNAPQFGQQHPEIYGRAFDIRAVEPTTDQTRKSPLWIVQRAMSFVSQVMSDYEFNGTNLDRALRDGTANCMARTVLFHNLISPFEHLESGITVIYSEEYNSAHWLNTVSATDDDLDLAVDNHLISDGKESFGKDKYKSKLRISAGNEHFVESCFGGILNMLEVLEMRRVDPEHAVDEHWIRMLNKTTDMHLTTVSMGDFENAGREIEAEEDIEDASGLLRSTATMYFGKLADAVSDVCTGQQSVLADTDLLRQIIDITTGKVIEVGYTDSYNVTEPA